MSDELSTQVTGILDRYGSPAELQSFMERSASIFQIPPEDLERPAVQAALLKATQYCLRYGYLPGIHVHMIPFNVSVEKPHPSNPKAKIKVKERVYAPDMGEKAWKDSADRIAQMEGIRYVVQTRAMTDAEVQKATERIPGQEYTSNDMGCRARVLRSDHAELYAAVGDKYDPEWVMGFWRQKSDRWGKPDRIPNGRTPADVALRRATKAALMAVFHLVPLDEYEERQRFQQLNAYVEEKTAIASLPAPREEVLNTPDRWARDEDGEIWETARPILVSEELREMAKEPKPSIESLDDVEEMPIEPTGETEETEGELDPEPPTLPENFRRRLHAVGTKAYGDEWDKKRHALVKAITKGQFTSSNELTTAQAAQLIQGMERVIAETEGTEEAKILVSVEEPPF